MGTLATGEIPDVWPHTAGRDDEETRKRVFTALRSGARAIVWDNVVGTFDSAALAAVLTAATITDRVLGKSEAATVPNRALFVLTGNNISLAGDLPRRVLVCRIDPHSESPIDREFDFHPVDHVSEHRVEIARSACILIRAQLAHATERAPGRTASFEAWDGLVRQTVVWAGRALEAGDFGDPLELLKQTVAADPETEALGAVMRALQVRFGAAEFSASEVIAAIKTNLAVGPSIAEAVGDLGGDRAANSARSLGKVLRYREGRIVHGLKIIGREDRHLGARKFKITDECGFGGYGGFNSRRPRGNFSEDFSECG